MAGFAEDERATATRRFFSTVSVRKILSRSWTSVMPRDA